ncbi:uncharacterized protein LOC126381965 [Pectinophora gossypiella]|uniref:uncharacterized protein LOC126381965 n=1 Tax=Pectinophora gossypiella TaxID=13191 RepID=UPI00214F1FBC|nr:uncharacterized protein LOC126381965 [Pectinophora gossypiella]
MASLTFESLDEEVKELLKNYKHKKATVYEPCDHENFRECLIGLSEELGLLNINYTFNPHLDVENETLCPEALVKLINSVWTLLHRHKNTDEKAERLVEQNHVLEHNNKQLHGVIGRLKEKSSNEKNESRACIATAQRISDRSEEILKTLTETRQKLTQLSKQKESTEKGLKNEIARLKLDNNKLMDRLRNKSDGHMSCSDVCDSSLLQLRERERKQRTVIAQLQNNNQDLLREVIALKEELILSGLTDFNFKGKK